MDTTQTIIRGGYIHQDPVLGNFVHGDGKLGTVPLQPDGQWDGFLPESHQQNINGFEPFDCVTEATINCVETLEIQEYGTNSGWARRYLAKNSGTDTRGGNDPQTVGESLRLQGTTFERDYSFAAPSFDIFYQTLTDTLKTLALGTFAKFSYGHSWVNADQQSMMDALTFSPLSAAGFAWSQPDPQTGYYTTPPNVVPEHEFMVYGYERNNYWKVRDSYVPFEKKLAWDFSFTGIKRHTLNRQAANTPTQASAWNRFMQFLYEIFRLQGPSFGAVRSPEWPRIRAAHLLKEPSCQVCGGTTKLNVHHIRPFHLHPELELDDNNLITLCTGSSNTINCHVRLGHWDNFKDKYNPNIRAEAPVWLKRFLAKVEDETL